MAKLVPQKVQMPTAGCIPDGVRDDKDPRTSSLDMGTEAMKVLKSGVFHYKHKSAFWSPPWVLTSFLGLNYVFSK